MPFRSALVLVSLLAAGAPAAAQTLASHLLTARFDDRGLTSVELGGQAHGLARDDFSITIDGTRYDSNTLDAPRRRTEQARVTYAWTAGPYAIETTYEVQPGWGFVTKQITIAASPAPFRVDEIVLVRAQTAEPVAESYVHESARPDLGLGSYLLALRFAGGRSLLAAAQNPFLRTTADGTIFTVGYQPDMAWAPDRGPFVSDRAMLVPVALAGSREPARMLPEWHVGPANVQPGLDTAEIAAMTEVVRRFLLYRPAAPLNIFVGWCVNDYQIDIATPEGRAEYKRVIDRAAELGARHVLFAPTNSDLARRDDSTDDWKWENLLWLGLGQKIRRNEWSPATGEVPASVREMLEYARTKSVALVAYVYPVLAFSQNPAWLTTRRHAGPDARRYASLASPALQDWLIETLTAFRTKTGISGYSFDHTFLNFAGASSYAQWWGWRRVMETLRREMPDVVIDGRQAYHLYGPWGWLAGSYPHPTLQDEQPESFEPFPDLSFDRVSANRERYTAYFYRNHEFAPAEIMPGFITHQTSRSDDSGDMPQVKTPRGTMLTRFRARDWDYLGWRYSLLSSIAVAAWNNVINMIPARDPEEYRHFPDADKAWFREWIEFAERHRDLLRRTRTILGQPALGKVDGTAAIEGNRGFIFLFNPNPKRLVAQFPLDAAIGLAPGTIEIVERYPRRGRRIGKPAAGFWSHGDAFSLGLDGHSATVLEVRPATAALTGPLLFNVPGDVRLDADRLVVSGATGQAGTNERILVLLPESRSIASLEVNGQRIALRDRRPAGRMVEAVLTFDGAPFSPSQQVGPDLPGFTGGTFTARFSVPKRVFDQLAARRKAWPIPWTPEDLETTWLAPERLLLHVMIAEPDDKWQATMTIDGREVALKKAYSAVRAVDRTFVGFYADVSWLAPDTEHELTLVLPPLRPGQFQGVFFENVVPEYTNGVRPHFYVLRKSPRARVATYVKRKNGV